MEKMTLLLNTGKLTVFASLSLNRPGIRRNFIGTARGYHHWCVDSAEGERDSSRGDVDGHVHRILTANPEHGDRARPFRKGHGKRGLCSLRS